ncbi:MAG TPA: hypothetical protein VIV11_34640, partial [Kofleriaceae bacterium]
MGNRASIAAMIVLCTAGAVRADDQQPSAVPAAASPQKDLWTQRNVGTAIVVTGAIIDLGALFLSATAISER